MDKTQTDQDAGETQPSDADLNWTGWVLEKLREVVDMDIRAKRMALQQQTVTPAGREEAPDFALMQSRLSRSIRLSIAMAERVRGEHLHRRGKAKESGAQERRRRRREQAVRAVVEAVTAAETADLAGADPAADPEATERLRAEVWERLAEDEVLDVRIDTLTPDEFVREICRWLGRRLDPSRLPQGWDDVLEADDNAGSSGAEPEGIVATEAEAGDDWPEQPDTLEDGGPPPKAPQPDSS